MKCDFCKMEKLSENKCVDGLDVSIADLTACLNLSKMALGLNSKETVYRKTFPVPIKYKSATLDEKIKEHAVAMTWLKDFLFHRGKKMTYGGIYIHGGVGNGKTYTAAAITNELMAQDIAVAFAETAHLINEIKAGFDQGFGVAENKQREVELVDVLVLDDFGQLRLTDYVIDVLWQIINERCANNRITIITSNCDPLTMFRTSIDRFESQIIAMIDRLLDASIVIELKAKSRRSPQKKYQF